MNNKTFSLFLGSVCVCKAVDDSEALSLLAELKAAYPGEEVRLENV